MAQNINSVTLALPSANVNGNVGGTFQMRIDTTPTGHGGSETATVHAQYRVNAGAWADIPNAGGELTTPNNALTWDAGTTQYSYTVTMQASGVGQTIELRARAFGVTTGEWLDPTANWLTVTISDPNNTSLLPSASLTVAANAGTSVTTENHISTLAGAAITVTANAPQVVATENHYSQLPSIPLTLTPNVPTANSADANRAQIPSVAFTLTANVPTFEATERHLSQPPNASLSITANPPQAITTENNFSQLPAASLAVSVSNPQAVTTEGEVSLLPSVGLAIAANVPQGVTTENTTAVLPSAALSVSAAVHTVIATENRVGLLPSASLAITANAPTVDDGAGGGTPVRVGFETVFADAGATGSATITVPATCDCILFFSAMYASAENHGLVALDVNSANFVFVNNFLATSAEVHGGQGYLVNPATGSQTFSYQWTDAPAEGGQIHLIYLSGVDTSNPLRGSDFEILTGPSNLSVPSTALDYVAGMLHTYSPAGDSQPDWANTAGQTVIINNYNGAGMRTDVGEIDSPGDPTTTIVPGLDPAAGWSFPIFEAMAIRGVAAAGENDISLLPSASLAITANAPQAVTPEDNVSAIQGANAIQFLLNPTADYDYATQLTIPDGFGDVEFTLKVVVDPYDIATIGNTTSNTEGARTNWAIETAEPGDSSDWWYLGNFLLDGHQNGNFGEGTFSIQVYNSGRVRWTFGDGDGGWPLGGLWGIQNSSGINILDGNPHVIHCVRRWQTTPANSADLELWVDGVLQATVNTGSRTNMATAYWDSWTNYSPTQQGWFWGAEKQAALGEGGVTDYADFKGRVEELAFYGGALSSAEIAADQGAASTGHIDYLDHWAFREGSGASAFSEVANTQISLLNSPDTFWVAQPTNLTITPNAPQAVTTENNIAVISSASLAITTNAPQVVATENTTAQISSAAMVLVPYAPQAVTSEEAVEQEGFRWRDDDGNEVAATWLQAQDVNISRPALQNTRLRILLNTTNDVGASTYRLQFKEVSGGEETWRDVEDS